MKARGRTKIIIDKVTEIQLLVGQVKLAYQNDGGWNLVDRAGNIQPKLDRIFELCVEIQANNPQ